MTNVGDAAIMPIHSRDKAWDMATKLTAAFITRVTNAKQRGYYVDERGLYLRVTDSGAASWVFRYRVDATRKVWEMGIGSPVGGVSLHEARERAAELRKQLRLYREGVVAQHPLAARQAAKQARKIEAAKTLTFRQCAEAYIAAHQAGWRNATHAKQWPETLAAYAYPVFGTLPVSEVDVGLVMRALEPIWTVKPETASRVRGRIEAVLDWATAREYRKGENPARWRGHLENLLPKRSKVQAVKHHAALPYGEVPEFLVALRAEYGAAARVLEFVVLTAVRAGEALGATWAEINLAERVWVIPAERTKAGREHRVPLSEAALAVLGPQGQGLVFTTDRGGRLHRDAMRVLLGRMGVEVTVHGMRSAFADWAAERTSYPFEVREMALAHAVGSQVVRAYQRTDLFDRRRRLMDDWARWCAGESGAEVVALRA